MDVLSTEARTADAVGPRRFSVSVVVPLFNEEDVLRDFHHRLSAVLDAIEADTEIVCVNDGSSDRTMALLAEIPSTAASPGRPSGTAGASGTSHWKASPRSLSVR